MRIGFTSAWRERSLPTSFAAIKGIRAVSYSQFGEDVLVRAILGPTRIAGVYVDVGSYHPIKWSNTYAFYLLGWSGVCIDPNRSFAPLWKRMRPRDRFIDVAISTTRGQAIYIENPRAPAENRILAEADANALDAVRVETGRLDELLAREWGSRAVIDLMSIDCEGHDLEVLMSNDFSRYRPHVLVVEDSGPLGEGALHRFSLDLGYRLVAATHMSRVYEDTYGSH